MVLILISIYVSSSELRTTRKPASARCFDTDRLERIAGQAAGGCIAAQILHHHAKLRQSFECRIRPLIDRRCCRSGGR